MALTNVNASHTRLSLLGTKQRSQDLPFYYKPYEPEGKPEAEAEPHWHRSRSPRTPSIRSGPPPPWHRDTLCLWCHEKPLKKLQIPPP